jgi:hypothetical protein
VVMVAMLLVLLKQDGDVQVVPYLKRILVSKLVVLAETLAVKNVTMAIAEVVMVAQGFAR